MKKILVTFNRINIRHGAMDVEINYDNQMDVVLNDESDIELYDMLEDYPIVTDIT